MIYIASDHRGFELKNKIAKWLEQWNFAFEDKGPFELDMNDDYPDFVSLAAKAVSNGSSEDRAIVIGYSGQGEAIVANKYNGIRAVVFYGKAKAIDPNKPGSIEELSRSDDNANVLSIGAGFVDEETARDIIKTWLDTPFKNEERHVRRLNKITKIEQKI